MPQYRNAAAIRQTIIDHASRTGTALDDGNPEIGAWHLLADLVELYDAEGWDFRDAVREVHASMVLSGE